MMDTLLFADHVIVVFAITATAAALLLSVLGLATTHQIRSDMKDQFGRDEAEQQAAASKVYVPLEAYSSRDAKANDWASLRDQFNAVMREGADSIEDMLDEQFRRRFSELIYRTARARRGSRDWNDGDITAVASL
jgi:hypothetical protein